VPPGQRHHRPGPRHEGAPDTGMPDVAPSGII
jgi:hypothetical protein